MGFSGSGRGVRCGLAVGVGCCLVAGAAWGRPAKVALSAWDQAVKDRAGFEAEAAGTHSKAEFRRVEDEFRAVYYTNPGDVHAPAAVEAVAELLAEQGRELKDEASLKAAAGQYEFLRKQYPGSSAARGAAGKVAALKAEVGGSRQVITPADGAVVGVDAARGEGRPTHRGETAMNGAPAVAGGEERKSVPQGLKPDVAGTEVGTAEAVSLSKTVKRESVAGSEENGRASLDTSPFPTKVPSERTGHPVVAAPVTMVKGRRAEVTGIRHWSTATYTRVAIDLGDEVTFEAARVPNPDRIYFDLHGARLAQELVGKSFAVTDDGFLKKIRAAQFSNDMTRVVLDVSDVTEYSAFLLPNPYRLIIDIHGGKAGNREKGIGNSKQEPLRVAEATTPVEPAAGVRASAAANSSGLPAMAVTDGGEAVRGPVSSLRPESVPSSKESGRASLDTTPFPTMKASERMGHPDVVAPSVAAPGPRTGAVSKATAAKPVPNTTAVKSPETETEVAAVSTAPGRVEATREASNKPIAATVPAVKDSGRDEVKDVYLGTGTRKGRSAAAVSAADGAVVGSAGVPAKAAEKTADGQTSLVRALGLKIGRIVIDAGHGGHDSGTLGADGIEEKDVVLDVALRLGKLLHERLGAEIIYTRSDDTFIPLETRTAIANKAQADLFLSIHANSSADETARGVETYYLNFTSDPTALDVAARENAVSGQSIHQLSDLVKKITLKDKISESREFAGDVESSLYGGLRKGNEGLKDRGVKKAPFVVLIGANMPSILAEISFVTNPKDAEQLRRPEYRERVAESLFAGVAKYEGGLSGGRGAAPIVRAAK